MILIAVMVSMILLSIGMFIANIALREIHLSSSTRETQKAFFAADSVLECAMFKEFRQGGFSVVEYDVQSADNSLNCNNKNFGWETSDRSSEMGYDTVRHVYYVSLSKNILDSTPNDQIFSKDEIESSESGDNDTRRSPYVKLIVDKAIDYQDKSRIQVFGHNLREGLGVIERAIEVVW